MTRNYNQYCESGTKSIVWVKPWVFNKNHCNILPAPHLQVQLMDFFQATHRTNMGESCLISHFYLRKENCYKVALIYDFNYADFSCLCDWKAGSLPTGWIWEQWTKKHQESEKEIWKFSKITVRKISGFTVIHLQSMQGCIDPMLYSCILNQ